MFGHLSVGNVVFADSSESVPFRQLGLCLFKVFCVLLLCLPVCVFVASFLCFQRA